VLRRGFLRDLGLRFQTGGHGELTVTWPALLSAARIAAAPGAEYIRRTPPNAVSDGSAFDVFDRYDQVFELADSGSGVPSARRRLVLPEMLLHELAILKRVPPEEREAFFRRMSESYCRHKRGDEPAGPGRLWGVRERLVERGSLGAFRRLEQSLGLRGALGRKRRAAVRRVRSAASPRRKLVAHYRARLEEPIDPDLAVFAAYWYRGYSCNPRAIYERAPEIVPGMRGVWVVNEDVAATMPAGVEYVVADTPEYYDLIARAGYFVNNVNFPNHLVKREGAVHVMTHHGTPLKRMGLDLRDTPDGETRIDYAGLLRRCARWDFSITQNAFTTLIWERTYPIPYETLEVGYPRNDVLVNSTEKDVRRIRDELGVRPGQKVVFYAPTHREYRPDYVPALDLAAVAERLGPDFVVMARLHYLHEADQHLRELRGEGRVRDVAAHPSVEELCLAADVLVTDYSSIMFDYVVLDRPIVIHAPDWEEYRAMRGTYFDITAEAPGVVTTTEAEMTEAFTSGAVWGEEARRARAAFRARFCALDDGHAAERVVRRVWLGEPASAVSPAAAVAG
jgi:CDP-glycerol glycerophosphotransferase